MPELPEVETVCRSLAQELAGRSIAAVRALRWERLIEAPSAVELCADLCDRAVLRVERRAKYILIRLDREQTLVIHLRMTGQVLLADPADPIDKHTHIILELDDGRELRFRDPRKFGRWWLLDPPGLAALDGRLGPEPLDPLFTPAALRERIGARRMAIKPVLLDQSVVAGVGNIYADEALWRAEIHPLRSAAALSDEEIAALQQAIVAALASGIERRGTSFSDYRDARGQAGDNQHHLYAYGRAGKPCARCGAPIERIVVAQRSTHLCPHCQQL